MPSGGHARSGPAPDPGSRTSARKGETWTTLPIEGRGNRRRAPKFPLPAMTEFEEHFWLLLWKKPQAVMWEKLGLEFQVAAYVRAFVESTAGAATAGLKTAVLRMEDTLGLSADGLARLRWRIAEDEVQVQRGRTAVAVSANRPMRRLRAVGDG